MTSPLDSLRQTLEGAQKILILSHIRPDGDAYGSALGLSYTLRALGKDVEIANEDGLLEFFQFLPGSELVQTPSATPPPADRLVIAVDTSDLKRLGNRFMAWNREVDVVIDHHVSNPGYGRINHVVADAPATAQVIYDMIEAWNWPLSPEAAACLYVGIMTDTGSFCYRSTTAHTLEVASRLITAGADPTDLAQACYQSFAPTRFLLQREVYNATQFSRNYQIAWFILTPELFARAGANSDETEGLVEALQAIKTVEVAFMLEVMADGTTRGSMRSRGLVDVRSICAVFKGGGHRLAAGLRSDLKPDVILPQILSEIEKSLAS